MPPRDHDISSRASTANNDGWENNEERVVMIPAGKENRHHDMEQTMVQLQNGEYLHLPITGRMDRYLEEHVPCIRRASERLMATHGIDIIADDGSSTTKSSHKLLSSKNNNNNSNKMKKMNRTVLNILQGEMAHAASSDVDILVSDDATTCHILAVRSYRVDTFSSTSTAASSDTTVVPHQDQGMDALVSMAHIDSIGYDADLDDMMREHVTYHHQNQQQQQQQESSSSTNTLLLRMDVHIMGGFDDDDDEGEEGSSLVITHYLLRQLSKLAAGSSHHPNSSRIQIQMILHTCAATCMNTKYDDGHHNNINRNISRNRNMPLSRGFAMEVASGRIFRAHMNMNNNNNSATDPASSLFPYTTLRSCRIFCEEYDDALSIIHRPGDRGAVRIAPFRFVHHPNLDALISSSSSIAIPDAMLLQLVSTSPHAEGGSFCDNFRKSVRYLKEHTWMEVFGPGCDVPVVHRRRSNAVCVAY